MSHANCWEATRCGKQGSCVVAQERRLDGIHNGVNGGRACWVVAGTLCNEKVQGKFAIKLAECMQCAFYRSVRSEEGPDMLTARDLLELVK